MNLEAISRLKCFVWDLLMIYILIHIAEKVWINLPNRGSEAMEARILFVICISLIGYGWLRHWIRN